MDLDFVIGAVASLVVLGVVCLLGQWAASEARNISREETHDIRETLRTFKGSLVHLEGRVTKLEKQLEKA